MEFHRSEVVDPHAWGPTRDTDEMAVIKLRDADDLGDRQRRAGEPVIDECILAETAPRAVDPRHIAGVAVTEPVGLRVQSFRELFVSANGAAALLQRRLDHGIGERRLHHQPV